LELIKLLDFREKAFGFWVAQWFTAAISGSMLPASAAGGARSG
jgi:hypothetical protein